MARFVSMPNGRVLVPLGRNLARSSALLTKSHTPTLLWVDDYAPGLVMYAAMFESLGYRVLTAASGQEAIRIALSKHVDVVVTDYEMPGLSGETVAAAIKALYPGTPVILFSGSTLVPSACRRVVDAICDKASSRKELLAALHRLLHKKPSHTLQPPLAWRASENRHRTVA